MKKIIFSILFCLIALPAFCQQVDVVSVKGDAEVKRTGSSKWETITQGMKLAEGDQISTGYQSTVDLAFAKNSVVNVKPLTQFTIHKFGEQGNLTTTNLDMKVGQVTADVAKGPDFKSNFSVTTPSSVVSVRGTKKDVDESDMGTQEHTHYGSVYEGTYAGISAALLGQSTHASNSHSVPPPGVDSSHDNSRTNTTSNTGLTDDEKDASDDYTEPITDPGQIGGAGTFDQFEDLFGGEHASEDMSQY